jgi:hypothetical protein
MLYVNKNPDNSAAFQALALQVRQACSIEEFTSAIPRTNPSPAQIFQTLEIVLLSRIERDDKPLYLRVLSDYIEGSLKKVPGLDTPDSNLTGMMNAYRDAGQMITFMTSELTKISSINRGANGLSAEDIQSYLFAKTQDSLRLMLRVKGLSVEDRAPYTDPAPLALERSRDDFLEGTGTLGEQEVMTIIAARRES